MVEQQTSNPYASPDVGDQPVFVGKVAVDFAPIVKKWERLRLVYVGILVTYVLIITLTLYPTRIVNINYWAMLVFGGLISNLCYFLGPAFEGYGHYLGIWHPAFTKLLFIAGLAFTTLMASATVFTF